MDKIISQAIEIFGEDIQLTVAVEELSELTKEICKYKRGNNNKSEILEEMADCYIVLAELQKIFKIDSNDLNNMIKYKIERLRRRMANQYDREAD